MLKLCQFPGAYGLPNLSPFCMKLECFLRMTKLEYEVVEFTDPRQAPKGKAPYIEDGDLRMGDSALIIRYLQNKNGIDLDSRLSAEQRAVSLAFQEMVEENLYWVIVYSRWMDGNNWPKLRKLFFGQLPPVVASIVPRLAWRTVRNQLYSQGMGRHSAEEIYAFGKADIRAIAAFLGNKSFMHGDSPTLVDACAFAHIANILEPPFDCPIREEAKKHPNLVTYCDRMMKAYF